MGKTKIETVKMTSEQVAQSDLEVQGLALISKQVKESVVNINSKDELRFLVDSYYQTQHYRITAESQIRAIKQGYDTSNSQEEIPVALEWVYQNIKNQEKQIQKMLDHYTDLSPVGQWCKSIVGIGPVITAGLIAYFDITKANHYNQFHSYAGLNDNNVPWLGAAKAKDITETAIKNIVGEEYKKYKLSSELSDDIIIEISTLTTRKYESIVKNSKNEDGKITKQSMIKYLSLTPYNKELKKLCWKIGESFVKVSSKEESLYGKLYNERKAYEIQKNEKGEYKNQAENILKTNNISKSTEAYKFYSIGKLPRAHINARAKRWTVKIFISHLFEAMYIDYYKEPAPTIYPVEHQGHVDYISPEVPFEEFLYYKK